MSQRPFGSFAAAAIVALSLAACSGEGPEVIDPNSDKLAQQSLFGVDKAGSGELMRYNELSGAFTQDEYQAVNGEALGRKVDAIYEHGDRLFLHHRDDGAITKLDLATRKKLALIEGFPAKGDGNMCSMAFSNLSQAWVVCYGSKNLFLVDAVLNVVADTIALPDNPTCVATFKEFVFVCMERADGTGAIGVLRSNSGGVFTIEKTISLASPALYAIPTSDYRDLMVLAAGNAASKPRVYYVGIPELESRFDTEIEAEPLTSYLGQEPTYVAVSGTDNMYLALPASVVQIPYNGFAFEIFSGSFPVIAVDRGSELLYAYEPVSKVVKRRLASGQEIADLSVPAAVRSIFFLGTNRIR